MRMRSRLGIAIGIFGAAAPLAPVRSARRPGHRRRTSRRGRGDSLLQSALDPITRVLMASAILLPTMLTVDRWTSGWTRRRASRGGAMLAILGFAAAGVPESVHVRRLGCCRAGDRHRAHRRVCDRAAVRSDDGADRPGNDDRDRRHLSAPRNVRIRERCSASPSARRLALLLGWWWFKALAPRPGERRATEPVRPSAIRSRKSRLDPGPR